MFSAKTVLLERFNVVVNKKWEQTIDSNAAGVEKKEQLRGTPSLFERINLNRNKNAESIERLEQRITGLEQQNDQLLHFINFLLDNLPDLVINIIHSNNEVNVEIDPAGDKSEICREEACCGEAPEACPTRREKEVLDLLVKGYCAKEIANKLFISETTVITHKKNLKEKFRAKNTVELISKAQRHLASK